MTGLALWFLWNEGMTENGSGFGPWAFLSIGAVWLFVVLIPLGSWIESRRKEREVFYRADTLRWLAESTAEGARSALELLREEGRQKQLRTREAIKLGGTISIAAGIGLGIFLRALTGTEPVWLCGLIPVLMGAAMLVYAYFLAEPVE